MDDAALTRRLAAIEDQINAIALLQQLQGLSLVEAKNAVDGAGSMRESALSSAAMELLTVRFPTDSSDASLLEHVARKVTADPSVREAEVVEGFGNGLDIKVVLA